MRIILLTERRIQVYAKQRRNVPDQEKAVQTGDEVFGRYDVADVLDPGRHRTDFKDEAGEHQARHESRQKRDLAGDELVFRDGRDEKPQPQRRKQEHRSRRAEEQEAPPERHVEHQNDRRHRQRQRQHPEQKIRNQLAEQQFAAGHGGAEQRFHRAALPFARDHQRGQQRADQRHDQRQRAGQQEVAALQLRVVPDAGFGVGRRRERSAGL